MVLCTTKHKCETRLVDIITLVVVHEVDKCLLSLEND